MEIATLRRWRTWVAVAIVLHCGFGVVRIPHAVIGKRWQEIDEFGREGAAAWRLRNARIEGLAAIQQLLATTPPDAVIAIRGELKGALEYAPPLLWPRLCCHADHLPAGADSYLGRPIARHAIVGERTADGEGTTMRLEPR